MAAPDAESLFDFAVERPEGFTWEDAHVRYGWDRPRFFVAARELRMILGHDDEINLVCAPTTGGAPWVYRLVGNSTDADARYWQTNRIGDMETRLATQAAVATSLAVKIDKRTVPGRKAAKISKTLTYLLGELADINSDEGGMSNDAAA